MSRRFPVDFGKSRRDAVVLRFENKDVELPRGHKFFAASLLRHSNASNRSGTLGALASLSPFGGKLSLARILATHQRSVAQPTSLGFQSLDLPFADVILLLSQSGSEASQEEIDYAAIVTREVTKAMEHGWAGYFDPMLGCQARAYPCPLDAATRCLAFLGAGVFAPRVGAAPVGWISVTTANGKASKPYLPAGELAALYREQSLCAFSGDRRLTPAICDAMSGLSGALVVGAAQAEHDEPKCRVSLHSLGAAGIMRPIVKSVKPSWGEDGVADAAYELRWIHADAVTEFAIEICTDERLSRLLSRPPRGPGFKIVGLIEPRLPGGRKVRRWWFDFDRRRDGLLCSSAMTPARKTVSVKGDDIEIWDWLEPGLRSRPRSREFSWQDIMCGDEPGRAIVSSRPLGWLKAPEVDIPIDYERSASRQMFALDWLDFSGAVEQEASQMTPWAKWRAERTGDGEPLDPQDIMLGRSPSDERYKFWIASPDGRTFSLRSDQALRPGLRVIIAGLILEFFDS